MITFHGTCLLRSDLFVVTFCLFVTFTFAPDESAPAGYLEKKKSPPFA